MSIEANSVAESVERILDNAPQLDQLTLAARKVSDEDCREIFLALKSNSVIQVVDVQGNRITPVGVEYIVECLRVNRTITELNLSNNLIGDEGAKMLDEALDNNHTLRALHLGLNGIAGRLLETIHTKTRLNTQPLLNNTRVTKINLSSNRIGPEGAQCFADLIEENATIKSISLNGNRIGDFGVKAFLDVLDCNDTIKELWVEGNNISSELLDELAIALQLNNGPTVLKHALKPLELNEVGLVEIPLRQEPPATEESEGALDDASLQLMCQALKGNTNVHTLDLFGNLITDRGADMLAQLLRQNAAITSIDLGHNRITGSGAEALAKAVMGNTSLTYLNLEGNAIPADILHDVQAAVSINVRPPSVLSASQSYGSQGGPPLALTYDTQNQSQITQQSQLFGLEGSLNQSAVSHFSHVDAQLQREAMRDDALLRGTQIVYARR